MSGLFCVDAFDTLAVITVLVSFIRVEGVYFLEVECNELENRLPHNCLYFSLCHVC